MYWILLDSFNNSNSNFSITIKNQKIKINKLHIMPRVFKNLPILAISNGLVSTI